MRGIRQARSAKAALAFLLPGILIPATAFGAQTLDTVPTAQFNIFDPTNAPIIHLDIVAPVLQLAEQKNGSVAVSGAAIEKNAAISNFTDAIKQYVPGTAAAATGEVHIRGSHGQYSYYLDGAPLPSDVTGSFSDLINPKDIEELHIYTGGFPAQYGGQLAAIFDVTAKSGRVGPPSGYVQQIVKGYQNYQTTGELGGSNKNLSYFFSGVRESTGTYISPVSQSPLHDAGNETVGFGKFDYQSGAHDRISFDFGANNAHLDIPNTVDQAAVGVSDDQVESGLFGNLIWKHTHNSAISRLVYYSHTSTLKYNGSPGDLLSEPGGSPLDVNSIGLARTDEDQSDAYYGLRLDETTPVAKQHKLMYGFDVDYVKVNENFQIQSIVDGSMPGESDPNPAPIPTLATAGQVGTVYGGDRSVYIQDDWTPGRTHINYGLRYDQHNADITTSQFSPRFNLYYTAGKRDNFRLFYDRLFQPASLEDVKNLTTNSITSQESAPFQPERDNFYQIGWTYDFGTNSFGLDAYYRDEINTIDDDVIGASQIDVPVNFSKGYARGVEATLDGPINPVLSYYANFARSWAQEAGPISGGLDYDTTTPGYIFDDHDQTNSAAFGLDYDRAGTFANLDGDYGSGFPYYLNPNITGLAWTHPHLSFDTAVGTKIGGAQFAFTVDNVLNHAYIIKASGPFTNTQWALGRQFGIKITQNF